MCWPGAYHHGDAACGDVVAQQATCDDLEVGRAGTAIPGVTAFRVAVANVAAVQAKAIPKTAVSKNGAYSATLSSGPMDRAWLDQLSWVRMTRPPTVRSCTILSPFAKSSSGSVTKGDGLTLPAS